MSSYLIGLANTIRKGKANENRASRQELIFDSGRGEKVRNKLDAIRTESAILEEKQRGICKAIGPFLWHMNVAVLTNIEKTDDSDNWRLKERKIDGAESKWVWTMTHDRGGNKDSNVEVEFSKPHYRDSEMNTHDPVKLGREPETAFTFTVENKSDASVNKDIKRTVVTHESKLRTKNNNLHFDISSSATGGIEGQEVNGGAHLLATVSSSFGGNFSWGEENLDATTTTKDISDEIILQPMGYYEVSAFYDKIDLERTIDVKGICDFKIKIKTGKSWGDDSFKDDFLGSNGITIEADNVEDLVRELCGRGSAKLPTEFWTRTSPSLWVWNFAEVAAADWYVHKAFNWLLDKEKRLVEASQTFEYEGASDVSLVVKKKYDYVYEDGEFKKVDPTANSSAIETINIV